MAKKEIKVVIFDLGGLILRSVSEPFSREIEVLYGVPKEKVKENYFNYLGYWELDKISENDLWRKILKNLKLKTKISELKKIYYSFIIPRLEVLEIIKRLRQNYKVALLTNVTKELMRYLNKQYHLNRFFDVIVPSYKYGIAKPRLKKYLKANLKVNYFRIYEIILKKLKIDPRQCIFVDDKKENLLPAKKLGMKTILFKNLNNLKEKLLIFGVKYNKNAEING